MFVLVSNYITAIVCLVTAFVIQRIYVKEKNRSTDTKSVEGIQWFSLAIFSWGLGAFINILLISVIGIQSQHKIIVSLGVLFSLLNSVFILMSIPSIKHYEKRNLVIRIIERFSKQRSICNFWRNSLHDCFSFFNFILQWISRELK